MVMGYVETLNAYVNARMDSKVQTALYFHVRSEQHGQILPLPTTSPINQHYVQIGVYVTMVMVYVYV